MKKLINNHFKKCHLNKEIMLSCCFLCQYVINLHEVIADLKNSFGAFGDDAVLNGRDELQVHVDNISPTELMTNPNPPHVSPDPLMHNVDNLDGLYFNQTDLVKNSNIYKLNVGASKWRR